MRTMLRLAVAVITSVVGSACSSDDSTQVASPPQESPLVISLSIANDTIPESTSKRIDARVTDKAGFLKPATVVWSSSNTAVATVTNGNVTALSPGTVDIIGQVGTASDTAHFLVITNDLSIEIRPSAAVVAAGDTLNFTAVLRRRNGDIVTVDNFKWTSSDTTTAEFVSAGSLLAKNDGAITISTEALERQATGEVRVFRSPVASVAISPSTANVYKDSTLRLVAVLRDDQGRETTGSVSWGSSDNAIATVNPQGVVKGRGLGSIVITATSGTRTASASIRVLGLPASTATVVFPSDTLPVSAEMQATVMLSDASGQSVTGRQIAWQSSNPSVATVTSTGMIKGVASGSSNISAIVDGVVATRRLYVAGQRATSISIVSSAPSVSVGQMTQLVARVLDQNGVEMSGQPLTWSSSNSGIATISSTGLMTGVAAGTSTIRASSGALSVEVVATVVNVPVASVMVSPATLSMQVGGKAILSASAIGADGSTLAGRVATWSSQNPVVASVSSSGQVTAIGSGTATIVATIEGKTANAIVAINAPPAAPVASIVVTLANASLSQGQQTQASAILLDAQGSPLVGRTVSWSSLDTAVAKVNSSGLVTAYAGGTVAILARSEGITGSASLTVSSAAPAPVASIELTVPTQTLNVGQQVQVTATPRDAQGNALSGRTISYSTGSALVLSVSSAGVVTGIGAGGSKLYVTSGGVTADKSMSVTTSTSPAIASITIYSNSTSLQVGQTMQASAVARDAGGNSLDGTTFTWTTSNAAVATVTSGGSITAVGAGSATISAASGGVTGQSPVTVMSQASSTVATVTVSLNSNITVGATAAASAVARDAQGGIISGRTVTWSSTNSSVASVSSSGITTGVSAGSATVRATVDGVVGGAAVTVSAPATGTAMLAELPRVILNNPFPARTGATINVPAGGDLQAALNNAKRGDEIVLAAGATYTGNFVLPAKSGTAANGWITIRSSQLSSLPGMGTRVTAAQAGSMPKIVTPNVAAAIATAAGTSGWWLAGLEITVSPSLTIQQYGLVVLGETGSNQPTLASVPSDIVLDRLYIHGQTTTNLSRCVALNSARTQITDSYIVECHGRGFDSQAIGGWNGPGPYKIVNNSLQGAGENIMFGGSDPGIPGLVPSDIEIRRNHLYTPLAWKGVWLKKNLLELKNAARVLIEENVMDGSWLDGQTGWAIILKSENQNDGMGCRWCRTTDVTLRRNLIRNAGSGINIANNGPHAPVDTAPRRIVVQETVLENIGVAPFTGERRGFQLLYGSSHVTLERNVLSGELGSAMALEGGMPATMRDNVWTRGEYGVIGSDVGPGLPTFTRYAPSGLLWSNQTFVGTANAAYPTGTYWVSSESQAPLAAQIRGIVNAATSGIAIP